MEGHSEHLGHFREKYASDAGGWWISLAAPWCASYYFFITWSKHPATMADPCIACNKNKSISFNFFSKRVTINETRSHINNLLALLLKTSMTRPDDNWHGAVVLLLQCLSAWTLTLTLSLWRWDVHIPAWWASMSAWTQTLALFLWRWDEHIPTWSAFMLAWTQTLNWCDTHVVA